jgi:CSLREA domain-containing protein
VLAVAGGLPAGAHAATLMVTTTSDELIDGDGTCSLREAVAAVDAPGAAGDCGVAAFGANTISLGAERYVLTIPRAGADDNATDTTNGDLAVVSSVTDLTILGAGTTATTIDASGLNDRVLDVAAGATATLTSLTVTGGHAADGSCGIGGTNASPGGGTGAPGADGGGIRNQGTLTLTSVAITGNQAGAGGCGGQGVSHGSPGSMESNIGNGGNAGAGGRGGGIYTGGSLIVTASAISGNRAGAGGNGGRGGSGNSDAGGAGGVGGNGACGGGGGGIADIGAPLTIAASTLSGDVAGHGGAGGDGGSGEKGAAGGAGGTGCAGGSGGGLSFAGLTAGTLSVTNATFAANASGAGGSGGHGGSAGNISGTAGTGGAGGSGGSGGSGGAIRVVGGNDYYVLHSTVVGNGLGTAGGGGAGGNGSTSGAGGPAGTAGGGAGVHHATPCGGTGSCHTTLQGTVVASNPGGNCGGSQIFDGGHNLSFGDATCVWTNGDPKLGALQDNGGPTATVGLGAGSAAIDQVPATGAGCPLADQRGVARPFGAGCDIGAYEVTPPAATTGVADPVASDGATVSGSVTPNAGDAAVHFDVGTSTAYGTQSAVQHVGGIMPVAVSTALAGLAPSTTYHYRVVAVTPDGSATGQDQTFTTAAPSPPGSGGPLGGGGATPSLAKLTVRPSSFRAANRGASIARTGRKGTTVAYTDSRPATTTFTVHRCTKRSGRRCKRYKRVGTFKHSDVAGTNRFHFTGRVRRRKLRPGVYRLSATARAGGVAGTTRRTPFRVVS